jgi:type IV secretory pathway TrbF-like protein
VKISVAGVETTSKRWGKKVGRFSTKAATTTLLGAGALLLGAVAFGGSWLEGGKEIIEELRAEVAAEKREKAADRPAPATALPDLMGGH